MAYFKIALFEFVKSNELNKNYLASFAFEIGPSSQFIKLSIEISFPGSSLVAANL